MRNTFPVLAVSDNSCCESSDDEPKWKPLLTEKERIEAAAVQYSNAKNLENMVSPLGYRGLTPINNLYIFRNAYLTSAGEVFKASNYYKIGEIKKAYEKIKPMKLPILRVKNIISYNENPHYIINGKPSTDDAIIMDFNGQSLDWSVFDSYPHYNRELSRTLKNLGKTIAKFENEGVVLRDSHISNYCTNGESITRIDLESVSVTDPMKLTESYGRDGPAIGYTLSSFGEDAKRSEILKNPAQYRFIAENTEKWGVDSVDKEYNKIAGTHVRNIFRRGSNDILEGYLNIIENPPTFEKCDLVYNYNNSAIVDLLPDLMNALRDAKMLD